MALWRWHDDTGVNLQSVQTNVYEDTTRLLYHIIAMQFLTFVSTVLVTATLAAAAPQISLSLPIAVPSIPVPSLPIPSIPALPTVPIPSVPALPTVPIPGIPALPTIPVPGIPAIPSVPLPSVPAIPTIPLPTIPDPTGTLATGTFCLTAEPELCASGVCTAADGILGALEGTCA
ncbi:hypothetical protein BXZ70DRAFT_1007336 [Cristinia sonorae]|uniref:Uncharacterized protein n=1 Tax=Cristinia sonorae TaxID=1940300 RepID=A0A8K0UQW8_9AGAR|nr:hypothetical protein BXZ70DRAFT_1007336 [Cristinia sonorae]